VEPLGDRIARARGAARREVACGDPSLLGVRERSRFQQHGDALFEQQRGSSEARDDRCRRLRVDASKARGDDRPRGGIVQ
jgi:hypothetical protein